MTRRGARPKPPTDADRRAYERVKLWVQHDSGIASLDRVLPMGEMSMRPLIIIGKSGQLYMFYTVQSFKLNKSAEKKLRAVARKTLDVKKKRRKS